MCVSWELVDRPEVATVMQQEREGPQGQSTYPTTACPKLGSAEQADSLVRQTRMMTMGLFQQLNLLCTSNKDVETGQARKKPGSKWLWF